MTEPVALFTQTDYDAERWTTLMLLWGLGEVTLTTDDAGMFVVDFDSAESADRTWKGKGPEECLAEVIESFTSEHWDFDALPSQWAAATAVASRESGPIPRYLSHTHSRLRFPCIPHTAAAHPAPAPADREIKPVAKVAEVHMSRYTLEWIDGPLSEGTLLYSHPDCYALAPAEHTAAEGTTTQGESPTVATNTAVGVPDVAGLIERVESLQSEYDSLGYDDNAILEEAATTLATLQSQNEVVQAEVLRMMQLFEAEKATNAQQANNVTALERENAEFRNQLVELDHCRDSAGKAEDYERERDALKAKLAEAVGLLEDAANGTVHTEMMLEFLNKGCEVMG